MAKKEEQVTTITVKTVTTYLRSTSVYSQGKAIQTTRNPNEAHDEHDERCWRERIHTTHDGRVFLPPLAFKNAVVSVSRLLNDKIPGKRNQTYSKQFECGVIVPEGITLDLKVADVESERLFVPSDGKKGGGTRVFRRFPLIREWEGMLTWHVTAPAITKDVFYRYVEASGLLIGVGRFRVERGGYYGQFSLEEMDWPTE